jgi:hypothetical protein
MYNGLGLCAASSSWRWVGIDMGGRGIIGGIGDGGFEPWAERGTGTSVCTARSGTPVWIAGVGAPLPEGIPEEIIGLSIFRWRGGGRITGWNE